jgi:hypothetical protein
MRVEYVDKMGSDLTVVNAARVSYAKQAERFEDKDEKLIKYLANTIIGHRLLMLPYNYVFQHLYLWHDNWLSIRLDWYGTRYPDDMWTFHPHCINPQNGEADLKILNKVQTVQ